jgi:hypothetical protein
MCETIALTDTTEPFFGGLRFWWLCPECGRRCGILYLPPKRTYFKCRLCHRLTYRSSQEAHAFDRLFTIVGAQMGLDGKTVERLHKMGF